MSLLAQDALTLLVNAHSKGRLAHAFLISGPKNSGKRELATGLCSHLLLCNPSDALAHPDAHSLAPESKSRKITIEQVRSLEQEIRMRSLRGGSKVALLFDADRLMPAAANAFLKTLEEPPPSTYIFLLSEQPEQLLETILSRCVLIPLRSKGAPDKSAAETDAEDLLCSYFASRKPSLQSGLWLAQQLQALLAKTKETILESAHSEFKAEEKRIKQAVDSKWIEKLEETNAARAEAAYIAQRQSILDTLESFWADVLLGQNQHPPRHLPRCSQHTSALASEMSSATVLRRIEAVAALRAHLEMSGISEPLALEHGILRAFAPDPLSAKPSPPRQDKRVANTTRR